MNRLVSLSLLLGSILVVQQALAAEYRGPLAVAASKDGKAIYVANYDGKEIAVVDPAAGKAVKTIGLPAEPNGLVLSGDGAMLYVTCGGPKSTVCAIETASGAVKFTLPAGHTASAPALSADGKTLWVCNRFNNEVAAFDLDAKKEVAKVAVPREPVESAMTPDGKTLFVANLLPVQASDSYDVSASVSAIDTATKQATDIRLVNGSASLRGICVSADGKYVFVTHILSRYQMPTTQLERGWMNTNALTIIDAAAKKMVNTILLDSVDLGAANPWGVAATADGKTVVVAHAGTHELSVIDLEGAMKKLAALPPAPAPGAPSTASMTAADVPNDLSFLVDLRRRVKLPGLGPRGIAISGDKVYVGEYFSDTLCVVDLAAAARSATSQIALGPKVELTVQRKGELFFHDADLCFQHWQSCSSCHPDARTDSLNWDLLNDGLGNPKNTKSMLLAHKTPPAMSEAVRWTAEEAVRAGIKHIQFAVRPEEDAVALDEYLKALKPVPSPALVDGKLSEAAERGKKLFFDPQVGCSRCHPEPVYSDLKMHDVGSRGQFDRRDMFDCPTLVETWRTAPYMHDGHWTTLKDLFSKGKHGAKGGGLDKLDEKQIDDLVEFVKSL